LGGGQEFRLRSGTENVASIVGFGQACEIAQNHLVENISLIKKLQTLLVQKVLDEIPETTFNGHSESRLSNNAHFTFLGVNGEDLIIKLDEHGIAASTGSACSVNTQKASHVLESMGFSLEQITGSLRLTVGIFNTKKEINETVDILKKIVEELRAVSPFKEKYSFGSKN
jgi:cysteine desulfurase